MANLASAALLLTTEAAALYAGLKEAGGKINAWKEEQNKGGGGSKGGGLLGGLMGGGKMLAGGAAIAGIGAVGVAAKLAKDGVEALLENMDRLHEQGVKAKTLGMKSDDFMGLSALGKKFGIEDMFTPMAKFSAEMENASAHGGELAQKLAKIGISTADMVGKSDLDKFKMVADAMQKIGPGGEQAAAAQGLFQKKFAEMLPILQMGGDGIEKYIAKMRDMGVAIDDASMEKIESAKRSISGFHKIIDGIRNRMTVMFAPIIEKVGNVLQKIADYLQPFIKKYLEYVQTMATIIGGVVDLIIEWGKEAVNWIGKQVTGWQNWADKMPTVQQVIITVAKNIAYFIGGIGLAFDQLGATWKLVEAILKRGMLDVLSVYIKMFDMLGDAGLENFAKKARDGWALIKKEREEIAKDERKAADLLANGWDKMKAKVDAWFDNLFKKQEKAVEEGKKVQQAMNPSGSIGINPLFAGSQQLHEAILKSQAGPQNDPKLKAQEDGNKKLDAINKNLDQINAKTEKRAVVKVW